MFTHDFRKVREIPIFDNLRVQFQDVGTPILNFNPEDPDVKSFVFGRHNRTAVYATAPRDQNDLDIQIKVQSDTGTHPVQCLRTDLIQLTTLGTKVRIKQFDSENDRRHRIAQGQRALIFKNTLTGAYVSMYAQDALKHVTLIQGQKWKPY